MICKIMILGLVMLAGGNLSAQDGLVNDTIKVSGNCGMCEKRIESGARGKGVKYAEWNVETKQLVIKYDSAKTTLLDIEKRIAKTGHDTENVMATDAAYEGLHKCCQYERPSH